MAKAQNFYRDWVEQAERFFQAVRGLPGRKRTKIQIEPPLSVADCKKLEGWLSRPMPLPVREFLTQGSRKFRCDYTWKPDPDNLQALRKIDRGRDEVFGGGELCPADELETLWSDAMGWLDAIEMPSQQAIWAAAFPILWVENGDYVALDQRQKSDDPPVVMLCHDDRCYRLAKNFREFLTSWQKLCYLRAGFLSLYMDWGKNTLAPDSRSAKAFRGIFERNLRE